MHNQCRNYNFWCFQHAFVRRKLILEDHIKLGLPFMRSFLEVQAGWPVTRNCEGHQKTPYRFEWKDKRIYGIPHLMWKLFWGLMPAGHTGPCPPTCTRGDAFSISEFSLDFFRRFLSSNRGYFDGWWVLSSQDGPRVKCMQMFQTHHRCQHPIYFEIELDHTNWNEFNSG